MIITLDTLELEKDTDYILSCKSNRVYNSKLKAIIYCYLTYSQVPNKRGGGGGRRGRLLIFRFFSDPDRAYQDPGLDLTYGINGSFNSPKKKFSINFTKANTKFCLSLRYNADNSYLCVNGKEIIRFKADNKNVNFPT